MDDTASEFYFAFNENGVWFLEAFTGGVAVLGTYAEALANDTDYTVRLQIRDATKKLFINGVERILYSVLPQNVARIASVGARLSNNLLGARLWIVMTTLTGLA